MASRILKALVFLGVLALALNLSAAYQAEDEWESDTGDSEDGFLTARSESRGSDEWDSAAGESESDLNDEQDDAELAGVDATRRQLAGGLNKAKCLKFCATVPEDQKVCCPLWCKYNSDQAKKSKGQVHHAQVKEAGWKSIENSPNQLELHKNAFRKFLTGKTCTKYKETLWKRKPSGPTRSKGFMSGAHRRNNPKLGTHREEST